LEKCLKIKPKYTKALEKLKEIKNGKSANRQIIK